MAHQSIRVKLKGDMLEWDKPNTSSVSPLHQEIATVEMGFAEFWLDLRASPWSEFTKDKKRKNNLVSRWDKRQNLFLHQWVKKKKKTQRNSDR